MATLNTQTFQQMVSNFAMAVQGAASQLTNFLVGSVLLALAEATAGVSMWLQGLILQVLSITRAATSSGSDVDSWMADYDFPRLAQTYATGPVTFSRFTPTNQAIIYAATESGIYSNGQIQWTGGSSVQSSDGTQQFIVIPDTTQAAYNSTLNAYVIPSGTANIAATVQALNGGTQGNVAANTVTQLTQAIQYVDQVTNASAFTNALPAETDAAYRARFQIYINSLSKATKSAVGAAVLGVQQGLSYVLVENQSYSGTSQPGYFYAVVAEGSTSVPSPLLSSISNAIDAIRPLTSTFGVFAAVLESANIAMTLTTATGYSHSAVVALVTAALQNYINTLSIGGTLYYTRLEQIAYDASPGVVDVSGVTLNGGTSDFTITNQQIIIPGTLAVA